MFRRALLRFGFAEAEQACGWALARAHALSGDRIAIAAYLGGSDAFTGRWDDLAASRSKYRDCSARENAASCTFTL